MLLPEYYKKCICNETYNTKIIFWSESLTWDRFMRRVRINWFCRISTFPKWMRTKRTFSKRHSKIPKGQDSPGLNHAVSCCICNFLCVIADFKKVESDAISFKVCFYVVLSNQNGGEGVTLTNMFNLVIHLMLLFLCFYVICFTLCTYLADYYYIWISAFFFGGVLLQLSL